MRAGPYKIYEFSVSPSVVVISRVQRLVNVAHKVKDEKWYDRKRRAAAKELGHRPASAISGADLFSSHQHHGTDANAVPRTPWRSLGVP
jgi:hypothetical protein